MKTPLDRADELNAIADATDAHINTLYRMLGNYFDGPGADDNFLLASKKALHDLVFYKHECHRSALKAIKESVGL